ncbi:MAG TPA: hypothetical protein VJ851_06320 [Jatrophihabitans sp.]|nr:hypothetical protein [Jatrophihabitans sp.]
MVTGGTGTVWLGVGVAVTGVLGGGELRVGVDVSLGVGVDVSLGVGVEVSLGVGVEVSLGVGVEVSLGVGVDVSLGVGVEVSLGVDVSVGVEVSVAVGSVGVVESLGVKLSVGDVVSEARLRMKPVAFMLSGEVPALAAEGMIVVPATASTASTLSTGRILISALPPDRMS